MKSMKKRLIKNNVFWVGAMDWNRRLFDSLIPLPEGTSYNAYLVRGKDKTVLLDTVDPTKSDILMEHLGDVDRIDYVVAHHAEQDHSGTLPRVLAKHPEARVLATEKCKGMLVDHLQIPADHIDAVTDGQKVTLGDKTLEFIHTPWVHWPETMCTYLAEDKILFSCDFFGSHYAASSLFVKDKRTVYDDAKRYYAEIMMPFRTTIRRNLEKVGSRNIDTIAPSHGPVYDEPSFIIDAYKDWTSENVKNEVVIPYISMHGSTEAMVQHLTSALADRGVKVHLFDLAVTDIGKLAMALVDAATMVVGTPTVLVGPHPVVSYAAILANAIRPKVRYASVVGSYGWGGKAVEQIASLIPNLKVELLAPVLCKGYPRQNDFAALDALADAIAQRHETLEKPPTPA
jgi:flavorubredoxin